MKNTPENKAKFFAQYWLQDVLGNNMQGLGGTIYAATMKTRLELEDEWLELKPLSQITNEDAVEVAKMTWADTKRGRVYWNVSNGKDEIELGVKYGFKADLADFLRSKGYALPWMGISVEEQVEFGWVKLKE